MDSNKTYIHVSTGQIQANQTHGLREPPLLVHRSVNGEWVTSAATELVISGGSKLVYRPNNPLATGAVVWIETEAEVITEEDKGIL